MKIKNLNSVNSDADGEVFYQLFKNYEKLGSMYTPYELDCVRHGFLDCLSGSVTENYAQEPFYKLIQAVFPKLTDTQKEILELFLLGFSKAEIGRIKDYSSSRSVLFHIEAINHKVIKHLESLSEQELRDLEFIVTEPVVPVVVDKYLNKYDTDDSIEWFEREILSDVPTSYSKRDLSDGNEQDELYD